MLRATFVLMVRSIRSDARLILPHLTRFFLVAVIFWALSAAHTGSMFFGAPGLEFFRMSTYLNFVFIAVGGVSIFANCITEEKEEQTLGLLRMAGLNPVSILIGKAIPRLLTASLLLVVQLPFTLLAITLGGVTLNQVLAVFLALLAFLTLVASIGLFSSVMCYRSSAASWMTGVILALLLIGVPWLEFGLGSAIGRGAINGKQFFIEFTMDSLAWLHYRSAWFRIEQILSIGFAESPWSAQVVWNVLFAIGIGGLSWIIFQRQRIDTEPTTRWNWRALIPRRRRRRAWRNAILWKEFFFSTGGYHSAVAKFILYPLVIAVMVAGIYDPRWNNDLYRVIGQSGMTAMILATAVELAFYTSNIFRGELKQRTFAPLMMLPISLPTLVYSKLAACLVALTPAVFYFYLSAVFWPEGFFDLLEGVLTEPVGWMVISHYLLFLHLIAFYSLFVKWGAMPLAFATVLIADISCIWTIEMTSRGMGDGIAVVLTIVAGVIMVFLHVASAERLKALAAS